MKYFLVFTPDRGSREDCNVYYSSLVIADDENEAQEKYKKRKLDGYKKYREKNNLPAMDEVEVKKFLEEITFGDESEDVRFELLEIHPIQ